MAENIPQVASSSNSPKRASKRTKRVHKERSKPSKRDALEILEAALQTVSDAGIGTGVVNLPKRVLASAGIVLAGVDLCPKCNKLLPTGEECPRHS